MPIPLSLLAIRILAAPTTVHAQSLDSLITTVPSVNRTPTCVRPTSGPHDTGPAPTRMIIPPLDNLPRRMRGQSARLRMHVTTSGRVDSVEVTGIPDSVYRERVQTSAMAYIFLPARRAGCLVTDWTEVSFTFPDEE